MKEKLCVYTCITGDYDNLHEITNPEKGIDYYCFTNNRNLTSDTWKIIYIENHNLDDHHLSRKIKMLGHPTINKKYDISVWMDSSIIWKKSIRQFVNKYFKDSPFAAFKHNQRQTVEEEAATCLKLNKDTKENITRTLSFLKSEQFPDNCGLYEMTVFIKKHNNPTVKKTMALWFQMNQTYSKRDQLTFTYCVWKTKLKVSTINLNVWNNQFFTHQAHNYFPSSSQCGIYYGSSKTSFDYDKYFTYQYIITNHCHSIKTVIPNDTNSIEINFASTPGIIIDNFKIENVITHISFLNHTNYNNHDYFFGPHSTAIIHGIFKKNQPFSFSFNLIYMNKSDLLNIIEILLNERTETLDSFQKTKGKMEELLSENQRVLIENKELSAENIRINQKLEKTLSNKVRKLARKTRDILLRKELK